MNLCLTYIFTDSSRSRIALIYLVSDPDSDSQFVKPDWNRTQTNPCPNISAAHLCFLSFSILRLNLASIEKVRLEKEKPRTFLTRTRPANHPNLRPPRTFSVSNPHLSENY